MVMGQLSTTVDIAVIGAGPGGYTAAIRGAQLGKEVILIEKDRLGGICTNVGCIPTKALIHAASVKHDAESDSAKKMGIEASIKFDFSKANAWKNGIVQDLSEGIRTLCKLNGVEIIHGQAFFTSSNSLSIQTEVGLRTIDFKKAILATGTKVKGIERLPYDHERIIDSDDALKLTELPQKLIIVGGGYIAVEMACMFNRFGSKVTLVHRGDRLLKTFEPEITDMLMKKMIESGIELLLKSEVESANDRKAQIKTPDGIKHLEFDKLLVATGRECNYDGLSLEKTKIQQDATGLIIVDQTMRTTDDNIYAVGDIVTGPQLAHKAFRQGKVAAEAICGQKSAYDNRCVPMVVFSHPEVAMVGLTQVQATEQYGDKSRLRIGKMPFSASGKAKTMNQQDGFVKIIANEKGMVLGTHIIGPDAQGLIAEAALSIETAATLEDIAITIHTHPTLSEALGEAAELALGCAIHVYKSPVRSD